MLETDLLKELSEQLQKMESLEKVDLSIVDTIDKLINSCISTENFWRDNEQITIHNSFLLYHASRNAQIILKKMRKRFIEAEKMHENPSVVHDSICIIPPLSELCATLSFLAKQILNKQLIDNVSEIVEYLRDVAYANDLLPTPKEEMEEIDQENLKKRFGEFAGTLQAMLG